MQCQLKWFKGLLKESIDLGNNLSCFDAIFETPHWFPHRETANAADKSILHFKIPPEARSKRASAFCSSRRGDATGPSLRADSVGGEIMCKGTTKSLTHSIPNTDSRLCQVCDYEVRALPALSPAPSFSLRTELPLETLNPDHIKDIIAEKLGSAPADVFSAYSQSVLPWFPVISHALENQLPPSWNEASLDFTLLALCISLLCTTPLPSPGDGSPPSKFQSTYLHTKSWIAVIEGLGINSPEIVQARILITLFEVAHGFYPAASISIAATVRAADALQVHPWLYASSPSSVSPTDEAKEKEAVLIWGAIHILDSGLLLAYENGTKVPVTDDLISTCNSIATLSLNSILTSSVILTFSMRIQHPEF
ncbi:hypothetical protein FE257_007369 [Aspergillus nanangensis]|uniref:Transcription factor domain-containing protein n=1 Tax=Aspergillus nanangensis TaxID=2582783 RepID=A0AAD4GU95_ASPNN|nr:hypothetical protein FE257_007369 [Aspergillus nanangensis]